MSDENSGRATCCFLNLKKLTISFCSCDPILSLALISGTLGFLAGIGHSVFQVAVEGAQVVSGIVPYPYPTPFFMYQTKVWTLLHQIPALMLRAGLSEITVSILLSGMIGMLSFLVLTLAGYALSKNPWVALGAPFLIAKTGAVNFASVYSVRLWGAANTYGTIGLSYNFLAITLISLKRYRIGGFLLGLSLAVHPAQAVLYILTTGLCFLVPNEEWRNAFKITRKFFLTGLLAAAVSLAIHWALTDKVTFFYPVDPSYVNAFVQVWDGHRIPVHFFAKDISINLATLLLSLLGLRWFRKEIPETAHFLLYAFTVTALLGFIFSAMTWLPPERLPLAFVSMMPARILNFGSLGFVLLLISLLSHEKNRPAVQGLILLSLCALILLRKSPHNLNVFLISALALTVLKIIRFQEWVFSPPLLFRKYLPRFVNIVGLFVFFGFFLKTMVDSYKGWETKAPDFKDWHTDPFYAKVSQGKGLLITDPTLGMQQLLTRRPVLLDVVALDGLPYAPEAGPSINAVLQDIYGVDLLNSKWNPHAPRISSITSDSLWESRSPEEWKHIGRKYRASEILTPAEVQLQLPITLTDGTLTLYRIPEAAE